MTREHAKELLPIITAFANGETIQFRIDNTWITQTADADFDFSLNPSDYRIKPKPREWFLVRPAGCSDLIAYSNPIPAYKDMICVREIIE